MINTDLFDRAAIFAVNAHKGTERKGKGFPYIIHPMETAAIAATMTNDQELLCAAILHDVVEDTEYTILDIEAEFGKRVADYVACETDIEVEGIPKGESWQARKEYSLERMKGLPREVKYIVLSDKLSNLRAIALDYGRIGDDVWKKFHVNSKEKYRWYYTGIAQSLKELNDTEAYTEYVGLLDKVFK